MATQNPIESEGTYPLPEAQLDRFLFKLVVDYPTVGEETAILDRDRRRQVVRAPRPSELTQYRSWRARVSSTVRDATRGSGTHPYRGNWSGRAQCLTQLGASPRGPIVPTRPPGAGDARGRGYVSPRT